MADAHGKLPSIGLIAPRLKPIHNGVTTALFPAKSGHGMTFSNGTGEGAGAAIHHPITRRAMNGIAMCGEGFGHHGGCLWAK